MLDRGYAANFLELRKTEVQLLRVVSAQVCKRRRLLTKTATVWFLPEKRPIYRRETTVVDELRIGLSELLRKAMIEQDADFLKEGVRVLSQALMEMEVQEHVGAAPHERTAGRVGQRKTDTASVPGIRG